MNRFEYAPEVLDWLAQLNRRELLGRYPAWNYPDTIPDDAKEKQKTSQRRST